MLAAVTEELCAPAGLLGPWLTALVRVHGAAGRKQGLAAITELKPRLAEAGLEGAWSVAELLRAYVEDLRGEAPAGGNRKSKPVKEKRETS